MPPETPATEKRPRRTLRRTLAIVLCLLLSPFAAFLIWSKVEASRLNRALDALEARHEPLDVDKLDPRPTTDEQRQASHLYAQAGKLVGETVGARLTPVGKTIEELCALLPGDAGRAERIAALREVEAPYAEVLDLLDRASALDAAGWDDADRPRRQSLAAMGPRSAGVVNMVRIGRLACTADGEGAAAALLATLRLRRVLPPSFFGLLPLQTSHSLQSLLTLTSPSDRMLETLQKEYEGSADEHAVEKRLLYVRAQWLSYALPGDFSEPPPGYFDRRIGPGEALVAALAGPARDRATTADLAEFAEAIEAARQPWPAKLEAGAALSRKFPSRRAAPPNRMGFFAVLARPSGRPWWGLDLEATVRNGAEVLARERASVGAVAVARYRRAHNGALPGSLTDLLPAYLAAPLLDPYTGSELKYRHEDAQYKVYSVGFNRQDDGGVWEQRSDLQTSRRGDPKDVGISVSTPARTGRAPGAPVSTPARTGRAPGAPVSAWPAADVK
jgi:hypothetical protein